MVGRVVEGTDAGAGAVVVEGVVAFKGVILQPAGYSMLVGGGFGSEVEGCDGDVAVCVRGTPEEDLEVCFSFEEGVGELRGGDDLKTASVFVFMVLVS